MSDAFYFIRKLNAAKKTEMLVKVIKEITHCNVITSSVTFDGVIANASMCNLLGCDFNDEVKPYFKNPVDNRSIYVIFDPSHMLKLIRNTLGNREVLFDDKDRKIEWNYFIELEKCSRDSNFGLTH